MTSPGGDTQKHMERNRWLSLIYVLPKTRCDYVAPNTEATPNSSNCTNYKTPDCVTADGSATYCDLPPSVRRRRTMPEHSAPAHCLPKRFCRPIPSSLMW